MVSWMKSVRYDGFYKGNILSWITPFFWCLIILNNKGYYGNTIGRFNVLCSTEHFLSSCFFEFDHHHFRTVKKSVHRSLRASSLFSYQFILYKIKLKKAPRGYPLARFRGIKIKDYLIIISQWSIRPYVQCFFGWNVTLFFSQNGDTALNYH